MGGYATPRGRRRKPLVIAVVVSLIFGLGTMIMPAVADTISQVGASGAAARLLGLSTSKSSKDRGILPSNQTWLERLNQARALFGSPPVSEDPELTRTAQLHAKYMSMNKSVSHEEDASKPGFSTEGDTAGRASNVGAGDSDWPDYKFIDMWATAPFHTAAMLRPSLTKVGLGIVKDDEGSWGALNVSAGIDWSKHPTTGWPRVFPTGSGVPYTRYWGSEWPDPTTPCGKDDKVEFGLPVIVDFGGDAYHPTAVTSATAELRGPSGKIDTCVTMSKDHGGTDWPLSSTQVLLMPRAPLEMGATYTGSVETDRGTAQINFTIGGDAPTPTPYMDASASPSPSSSSTASPTPSASASPSASATPTSTTLPTLPSPGAVTPSPTADPTSSEPTPPSVVQKPEPVKTTAPDPPYTQVKSAVVNNQSMLVMKMTTLETTVTTNHGSLSGLQATLKVRRPGGEWSVVTTKTLKGTSSATFRYTRVSLGVEELMVQLAASGSIPATDGNVVSVTY